MASRDKESAMGRTPVVEKIKADPNRGSVSMPLARERTEDGAGETVCKSWGDPFDPDNSEAKYARERIVDGKGRVVKEPWLDEYGRITLAGAQRLREVSRNQTLARQEIVATRRAEKNARSAVGQEARGQVKLWRTQEVQDLARKLGVNFKLYRNRDGTGDYRLVLLARNGSGKKVESESVVGDLAYIKQWLEDRLRG